VSAAERIVLAIAVGVGLGTVNAAVAQGLGIQPVWPGALIAGSIGTAATILVMSKR
jgi:hypothetical protein